MRKFIIDSDTASDDAVATIIGLLSDEIDVLGITTLCGNIPLETATANALATKELCGSDIGVYPGATKPLSKERVETACVHGSDGMGDVGLIHPTTSASEQHAVDFLLETIKNNPDEVEIIALGPATNVAVAILRDPEMMKKVKKIWSMGTGGFGHGNATPVAEFNVYIDAESYKIMLDSGIPITIIGFDLCLGDSALNKADLEKLSDGGEIGKFVVGCTTALLNYNLSKHGKHQVDLPDAVAIGVAIWEDIILEQTECNCYCCIGEPATYGQVIIADSSTSYEAQNMDYSKINATVIKKINPALFKEKMISLLCR